MEESLSLDEAVSRAQQRGYAEADPSLDLEGIDAAQKLAILASLDSLTREDRILDSSPSASRGERAMRI